MKKEPEEPKEPKEPKEPSTWVMVGYMIPVLLIFVFVLSIVIIPLWNGFFKGDSVWLFEQFKVPQEYFEKK